MLNRKICRKCIDENRDYLWSLNDDLDWDRELLFCPCSGEDTWMCDINGEPPEFCTYKFEHAVVEGMNDAQQ